MTHLSVLVVPNQKLRVKAKPVTTIDDRVRATLDDMLETMYKDDGCGLAAPQVGLDVRLLVMDVNYGPEQAPSPMKLVNPEILSFSKETVKLEEGCLSLPGVYPEIERPVEIRFRYWDENNVMHEMDADGILSRCVQHEIDHLDGILMVDHLSRLKREMTLRRLKRMINSDK